jgi:glycine/D-amino acid oxidase-like deaminating enzyme
MSSAPYTLDEDDVVPVLRGFRRIFPSLTEISGDNAWWGYLDPSSPEEE